MPAERTSAGAVAARPAATGGPEVVLDLELRGGAFLLVLANTGRSTAYQPRVAFAKALTGLGGSVVLSELPIWSGLALLRPGQQVDVLLDTQTAARRSRARKIAVTVTYADSSGGRHERRFVHDLATYDGLPTLG